MRFSALNSLKNRCISCTIHRKIYESFYVSHFSLICTHASWNIDYYKVRPQTLSILNEKRKPFVWFPQNMASFGGFSKHFKVYFPSAKVTENDASVKHTKNCISFLFTNKLRRSSQIEFRKKRVQRILFLELKKLILEVVGIS